MSMASASSPFSWRGLLQSLFDVDDAALGSAASPLASARTPRWSRGSGSRSPSARTSRWSRGSGSARSPSSATASAVSSPRVDTDDDAPYTPSRLDGEWNVWFARKPLGLGLVPSTQLYGTWEISSVAPRSSRHRHGREQRQSNDADDDDSAERAKIQRGDVVIAVNFDRQTAKLPRDAFAAYLERCACPVVVTLRRPALYGSFDSRAVSTAMFPASIEYRGKDADSDHKTFLARAPSVQWKRSLQHELAQTKKKNDKKKMKKKEETIGQSSADTRLEPTPEADPSSSSTVPSPSGGSSFSTTELSPMGEYTATFHALPLRMTLAPSTRLYGSVEVYDPKEYAPRIHIGDVLLAVNGDTGVAKWPMDDTINHIANLQVMPVTITFRRPMAYREYLETYFKQTRATVSSRSTSTAMFPESAEYKHRHVYKKTAGKTTTMNPPQQRHGSAKHKRAHGSKSDHVKGQGRLTKEQWLDVSKQLDATDQFKLWQSRASKRNAAKKAKANKDSRPDSGTDEWIHTSAVLTERHVQYLWAHLPTYLTCNDMELVYDTRRHGWNLLSFYSHVQDKGPTLLVVKDTRDQIFGAFSSTSWQQSSGDVYGNGRCFVFTLRPQMHVYAWSGLNDTFMSGRRDAILMGGGTKGIALCVQLDELRGFSTPCETFDSPSLASSQGRGGDGVFEMEHLEVWCFSGLRV